MRRVWAGLGGFRVSALGLGGLGLRAVGVWVSGFKVVLSGFS